MLRYPKNLLVLLWSLFFSWTARELITKFLFGGKDFLGRSLQNQIFLFTLYLLFFIVCIFLFLKGVEILLLRILQNQIESTRTSIISMGKFLSHPLVHLAILFWLILLSFVPRGFDITDNGYYLLISQRFEDVAYEIRLFGLITRLIFIAAGESVALMRLFGAAILVVLVVICGWSISKLLKTKEVSTLLLAIVSPLLSAAMYYYDWLSTPSYNWLALVSGLCLLIGISMYIDRADKKNLISGIVMGVSCFMAFLAKPTTAVGFFFLSIIVVFFERKKPGRLIYPILGIIIGFTFGIFFLYLNGQTIPGTIEKIVKGYQIITLFEHSPASIFKPLFLYLQRMSIDLGAYWIVILCIFIAIRLYFARMGNHAQKTGNILLVSFWLLFLLISGITLNPGIWAGFSYLLTLVLMVILDQSSSFHWSSISLNSSKAFIRSLYILVIAFSITFGTINNFAYFFAHILCIFTLATVVLIDAIPDNMKNIAQKGFVILLFIVVPYNMFFLAYINPSPQPFVYRQDVEIWEMDTSVPIRLGKERIMVSSRYAEAIGSLQEAAVANGLSSGTSIIDLTGMSPGIVYMLDGRSPIFPWLAGGYPNSSKFVQGVLKEWDKDDLQTAWILTAPNSRQLPTSILINQGLGFPEEYKKVTTITFPIPVDGSDLQFSLWKPTNNKK